MPKLYGSVIEIDRKRKSENDTKGKKEENRKSMNG